MRAIAHGTTVPQLATQITLQAAAARLEAGSAGQQSDIAAPELHETVLQPCDAVEHAEELPEELLFEHDDGPEEDVKTPCSEVRACCSALPALLSSGEAQ